MPDPSTKPGLSRETRAAILATVGIVVLVGGGAAVALSWNRIQAHYWVKRLEKGDARAVERLEKFGDAAVPALVAVVMRRDPGEPSISIERHESGAYRIVGEIYPHEKASELLAKTGLRGEEAIFGALDRAGEDRALLRRLYTALLYLKTERAYRTYVCAFADEALDLRGCVPDERFNNAVTAALWALAVRQEEDGRWDARRWGAEGGAAASDLEVTSLCTLAFLGAGHTPGTGGLGWGAARAAVWLRGRQGVDGRVGAGSLREHVVASLALTELWVLGKNKGGQDSPQRAADWLVAQQRDSGGWAERPGKEPDAFTSALALMQLKSARVSGLKVKTEVLQQVLDYFERLTVKEGEHKHLVRPRPDGAPSLRSIAAGGLVWDAVGSRPEDARVQRAAEELASRAEEAMGDPWAAWLGTVFLHNEGSGHGETWKRWRDMLTSLVEAQSKRGNQDGMWAADSAEAKRLGRAGATALRTMTLEVRYRFLYLYGFFPGMY